MAMIKIQEYAFQHQIEEQDIVQIHDELILEIKSEIIKEIALVLKDNGNGCFNCALGSENQKGKNWGKMKR